MEINCNLGVLCPNEGDATSFYRGFGPLNALKRKQRSLNLCITGKWNWATVSACDVMFMQRPFTRDHLLVADITNSVGRPLWIDYDDDLFSVPEWNPTFRTYGQEEVKKNVAKICARADLITVSTEALKAKLLPLNKNIHVLPNSFNDDLLYWELEPPKERRPLIMWRGSATHDKDLMEVAPDIIRAYEKFPDWTWTFVGYNPWFMTEKMPGPRCISAASIDIMEYHEFLRRCAPRIMIAPLSDCVFNRAKSNIAGMEGTFAGANILAPDLPEWQLPGFVTYPKGGFYNVLERMITEDEERALRFHREASSHISRNLMLSRTNLLRFELLKELYFKSIAPKKAPQRKEFQTNGNPKPDKVPPGQHPHQKNPNQAARPSAIDSRSQSDSTNEAAGARPESSLGVSP